MKRFAVKEDADHILGNEYAAFDPKASRARRNQERCPP
jgi:hypothetical protein